MRTERLLSLFCPQNWQVLGPASHPICELALFLWCLNYKFWPLQSNICGLCIFKKPLIITCHVMPFRSEFIKTIHAPCCSVSPFYALSCCSVSNMTTGTTDYHISLTPKLYARLCLTCWSGFNMTVHSMCCHVTLISTHTKSCIVAPCPTWQPTLLVVLSLSVKSLSFVCFFSLSD